MNNDYKERVSQEIAMLGRSLDIERVLIQLKAEYPTGSPRGYDVMLPGYKGEVVTLCEVWEHKTHRTPMALWWCRAVGRTMGLKVPQMDWAYYKVKQNLKIVQK